MPSKYQEYRQMADTAERQLTSSYKSWTQFLRTAARLYKYPYNEQVMIHAQRPDATACAEYDFWNKKMGRFVRRGSTGIALIDTSGQKPQLRYVFDVADTGEREHSRPVHLWQFRAEHEDAIAATLERSYDVSGSNGIVEQMESAAAQLAKKTPVDFFDCAFPPSVLTKQNAASPGLRPAAGYCITRRALPPRAPLLHSH